MSNKQDTTALATGRTVRTTRRATSLAAAVVAVMLLAVACGSDTATPLPTPSTVEGQLETRPHILQLARPQLDGAVFDPDSVAGRNVLFWFWAPW